MIPERFSVKCPRDAWLFWKRLIYNVVQENSIFLQKNGINTCSFGILMHIFASSINKYAYRENGK
mgnify:FL=1